MVQKFKCPRCGIETSSTERIPVDVDEEIVKSNESVRKTHQVEMEKYQQEMRKFKEREAILYDSITYHNLNKHWWQDKMLIRTYINEIRIERGDGFYTFPVKTSKKFPAVSARIPKLPILIIQPTHFIRCPTCHKKKYFWMENEYDNYQCGSQI